MPNSDNILEETSPETSEGRQKSMAEAVAADSGPEALNSGAEQDDDAVSIKTITVDTASESGDSWPESPEYKQHKLGLDINEAYGWSGSSYDDYDVVTVHGIRDDYKTAWINKDGKWWVRGELFDDLSIREVDYSYEVEEDSSIYDQDGIRLHAKTLLEKYSELRKELDDTETDRPIVWLCHDLGGIIVKEALSIAIRSPATYGKIGMLTTAIVFLGTPHRFKSKEDLEDQIYKLIHLPGPKISNKVLKKVKGLASQVDRITRDFLTTKLLDRAVIFNYFTQNPRDSLRQNLIDGDESESSNPLDLSSYSDHATPFPRYAHFIGHSFEAAGRIRTDDFDHLDLVRDSGWIKSFPKIYNTVGFPIRLSYQFLELQTRILSLAPPTRALDTPFDPVIGKPPIVQWIHQHEQFIRFSKPGCGLRLLHIYGSEESPVDIIETLRQFYVEYDSDITYRRPGREAKKSSVYFEFDQRDSRYNTLSSMLLYLINVHISKFWNYTDRIIPEELNFRRDTSAWSLEDLYHLFTTLRYDTGAVTDGYGLTYFIGNFDQCPGNEQKFFLERIMQRHTYNESEFRIILSTSTREGLAVSKFPSDAHINVGDWPSAIHAGQKQMEKNIATLSDVVAKRPIYKELQPKLESLLRGCSNQHYLRHITLKWLKKYGRGRPKAEIVDIINQLTAITPENLVRLCISTIPVRLQQRAMNIFNWVKHAAEPFSPESLAEALIIHEFPNEDPSLKGLDLDEFISEIETTFSGIVIVQGRDVIFSHAEFYESPEIGVEGNSEERAAKINSTLARICLRYFQLEDAHEALAEFFPRNLEGGTWKELSDAVVVSHPRTSLAEYATRFWPKHYRASGQLRPIQLVDELFENKSAREAWEIPFWHFSNPFTRLKQTYTSTLPIFAMMGLDDLVERQVKLEASMDSFKEVCWLAIIEAARSGYENIMLLLLEQVDVDQDKLQSAIFWAAASGKPGLVNPLIERIPSLDTFQWPEHLIYRAVAAGLKDLLAVMLSSGCNINEVGKYWGAPPVSVAVWQNRYEMVEALLNSKAKVDLTVDDKHGNLPTATAAHIGNPAIIELLLRHGASTGVQDENDFGLAKIAVVWCNHQAASIFIDSGADFHAGKNVDDPEFYARSPIIIAADVGSLECVRVLLDHGADPYTSCETGTALYNAVTNGHAEVVRLLLEHKPKPDMSIIPTGNEMLITRAVCTGNTEIVSLLIQHGAELDVAEPVGGLARTPLSRAVSEGHLEVVKVLLDNKADVNYVGEHPLSDPPLFTSLFENKLNIAAFLLEDENVDVLWRAADGMGTLHVAVNHQKLFPELLKRRVPVDWNSIQGTALHIAARQNSVESMKHLLENDPRPDLECAIGDDSATADLIGYTALQLACKNLSFDSIKLLLEAGANPASKNQNGEDSVDILLRYGSDSKVALEYLELMVSGKNRVSIGDVDEHSRTRLHRIRESTSVLAARFLVEAQVPLDKQDEDGYTPLAVAIVNGNEDVANYLIKIGASIRVYSPKFGSILHLAVSSGSLNVVKTLIGLGVDVNEVDVQFGESLLYTAIGIDKGNMMKMVKYLVDEVKVPVNRFGGKFGYPIIRAAVLSQSNYLSSAKCLKFLTRRNAQLNVSDDQGRRAVHHACTSWWDDSIRVLVKAGAEIDVKDKLGRMPIHFAAAAPYADCLEYLLGTFRDMDVNVVDRDNWTPLLWAARSGNPDSIRQLLDRKADISVKGRGYSAKDEWSALKLANFGGRGVSMRLNLETHELTRVDEHGTNREWDQYFHRSKIGHGKEDQCQSCLVHIAGIQWKCLECTDDFSLCFKCYGHRSEIHNVEHNFEEIGPLYSEDGLSSSSSKSSNSDTEEERPQEVAKDERESPKYGENARGDQNLDEDEFNLDDVDFDEGA